MHPAYSVIFFTTATGAGYGLLASLGLSAGFGLIEPSFWFRIVGLGLALALISAGLLSSTAHLGRPERAWRALSQWRSSWLSREGVAALFTYLPGLIALALAWQQNHGPVSRAIGLLLCASSVLTVACTAMIYASLPPIAAWRERAVLPAYVAYAMLGGVLWATAVGALAGAGTTVLGLANAMLLVLVAAGLKLDYWHRIDRLAAPTIATAVGLPQIGEVRNFERPHTEANYLMKEMGFVLARRHGTRLRVIALVAGLGMPALLLLGATAAGGRLSIAMLLAAALLFQLGALVERWLFFAQARHSVASYYGLPRQG